MSANQPFQFPGPSGPRNHTDPEDLVLYAMQFLTPDEASAVSDHLDRCVECRTELARIHGDLAACALTAELEKTPATARERLLKQVAREKKVVPIALATPIAAPQAPTPIAAFGRSGSLFNTEPPPQRSASHGIIAIGGWAIAACLAAAFAFLYGNHRALRDSIASESAQIQRLNTAAASSHQLLDALTDPRAVRVTLTVKPQPKPSPIAGVTYNPAKGSLVLLASNLDPLQIYKTYELWVIPADGSSPIPAGTFHPDDHGAASVIMPDLPKGVDAKAFGITIEDDGGSQTPTPPIIMSGS
jgi:hypothetical protein